MRTRYSSILYIGSFLLILSSCKKQLDVKNPNSPTPESAETEVGILNLAQGGVYINGFSNTKYSGDQLIGGFLGEPITYHSIMGDETWNEAANEYMNQLGAPYTVTLDDGSVVKNPNSPQSEIALLRQVNQNSYGYANPLYYEWAYSYAMNNALNNVLAILPNVKFSGDAAGKVSSYKAWAYYWKGYAYSRVGSLYYAGIINNVANPAGLSGSPTNGDYVSHQAMIAAAMACYDTAESMINAANPSTLASTLGSLIPGIFQTGLGGPPTAAMFIRNINTMRARDILVNNTVASMSSSQWDSVLNYANNGIRVGDMVFTARSDNNSTFMGASGNLAANSIGDPNTKASFQIMERLIQDFKPGDRRFTNNFSLSSSGVFTYPDRSQAGGTRWQLLDGNPDLGANSYPVMALQSDSLAKVYDSTIIFANDAVGAYEVYLTGFYEENELMKAEANIYKGNIDLGLQSIDTVRFYQGAKLAKVSGTGLTVAQAKEELRSERRIALMFRGYAFYDARRWGVINDVSKGGGRTGAWLIDNDGNLNTNATINYNYLDYWDVPDNELAYNKPSSAAAPVKNPQQ